MNDNKANANVRRILRFLYDKNITCTDIARGVGINRCTVYSWWDDASNIRYDSFLRLREYACKFGLSDEDNPNAGKLNEYINLMHSFFIYKKERNCYL